VSDPDKYLLFLKGDNYQAYHFVCHLLRTETIQFIVFCVFSATVLAFALTEKGSNPVTLHGFLFRNNQNDWFKKTA